MKRNNEINSLLKTFLKAYRITIESTLYIIAVPSILYFILLINACNNKLHKKNYNKYYNSKIPNNKVVNKKKSSSSQVNDTNKVNINKNSDFIDKKQKDKKEKNSKISNKKTYEQLLVKNASKEDSFDFNDNDIQLKICNGSKIPSEKICSPIKIFKQVFKDHNFKYYYAIKGQNHSSFTYKESNGSLIKKQIDISNFFENLNVNNWIPLNLEDKISIHIKAINKKNISCNIIWLWNPKLLLWDMQDVVIS